MSIDLITGFGWLVFKHPNLLEPNTDKLYAKYNINIKLTIILLYPRT